MKATRTANQGGRDEEEPGHERAFGEDDVALRGLRDVAIVLLASGVGAGALFIIPCMVMMGAMVWMMMGGQGSRSRGGDKT